MAITCRTDLKNYSLRALGHPALQINVTPEQVEDRIDDAIETYWEFHHEGSYRDYISHVVTQSEIDSGQIEVDEWVYSVLGVIVMGNEYGELNLAYQSCMQQYGNQFTVFGGGGLVNYTISMSYLSLVRQIFARAKVVSFNQRQDKIIFHGGLDEYEVGDIIVIEVYRFSDPETYRETYKDKWLRSYTVALIKKQWGQNMLKYEGFQLPSGMTLNGRQIYEDALIDIALLRERLFDEETFPADFFMG